MTLTLARPTITWPVPTPSSMPTPTVLAVASDAKTNAAPAPAPLPVDASDQSITIGGDYGAIQSFTFNGPTPLSLHKLTIGGGGGGVADFHQTGGVIHADDIDIGEAKGGSGTFKMTGDSIVDAGTVNVGGAGDATLAIASASANFNASHIILGRDAGSNGQLDLSDGQVSANDIAVGMQGSGVIKQTGGQSDIHSSTGADRDDTHQQGLVLALKTGSEGLYDFRAGHLSADSETVASSAIATFKQSSGVNDTQLATIGAGSQSDGTYKLAGGALNLQRSGSQSHVGLVIADNGTGALAMGDASGTGHIAEIGMGGPISVVVGQSCRRRWPNLRLRRYRPARLADPKRQDHRRRIRPAAHARSFQLLERDQHHR